VGVVGRLDQRIPHLVFVLLVYHITRAGFLLILVEFLVAAVEVVVLKH
jgi:hypothetical protein